MQAIVMLIYVWTGSATSVETVEFTSAETCEAARTVLLEAFAVAVTVDPAPQPSPIVLCVAR